MIREKIFEMLTLRYLDALPICYFFCLFKGYTMSHYTFKLAHIQKKKKEQKIKMQEFRELLIFIHHINF